MRHSTLDEICDIQKGKIGITKAIEGEYPLVTTADARKTHNEYHFDKPSVIIPLVSSTGHGHASIKRVHYQEGKFAVGSILGVVTPKNPTELNAKYLFTYLSTHKDKLLVSLMKGAANVSLPISRLKTVKVPIPSMRRQLEIVRKHDYVNKGVKKLGIELIGQNKSLQNLRQQILQDAICGKLTEDWRIQNSNIESAGILLEKIEKEKEKLFKEKKIRKQRLFSVINKNENLFKLPEKWISCRLGEIILQSGSGSTPRGGREVYRNQGIQFIRSQNVFNNGLTKNNIVFISKIIDEKMKNTRVFSGDLLLNITGGSIGRCALVSKDFEGGNINQHVAIIRLSKQVSNKFLHYMILSKKFQDEIIANTTGAGRQGLPKNKMDEIIISLPPVLEQKAIVERIEILIKKANQIEKNIQTGQQNSKLLSQVALHEALGEE